MKTSPTPPSGKRERLLQAAAQLFHRQGFEHTSLADIAAKADVPLGNVYYYFRTREELLKAVTDDRRATMQKRREDWEAILSPRDRLLAYVDSFAANEKEYTEHGCPAGSLCLEANKIGGEVAEQAAAVLADSLAWIQKQFGGMGFDKRLARDHALHLVGRRQGSVLLANTFKDPAITRREAARLKEWLADMPVETKGKAS